MALEDQVNALSEEISGLVTDVSTLSDNVVVLLDAIGVKKAYIDNAVTLVGDAVEEINNAILILTGTSDSAIAISTGAISVMTQSGRSFGAGQFLIVASTATPANYMYGQITSYDSLSGALSIDVSSAVGSGTFSDWQITVASIPSPPISLMETGNESSPGISFVGDPDTGLYRAGDNELGISVGGLGSLLITSDGIQTPGNVVVGGDLVVHGDTTTVNSQTITLDDPILTLGGDTPPAVDDAKDRGIEFRWHNGTSAKIGFFGFDRSTGEFVFMPDASNASEVFTGAAGVIRGSLNGNSATSTKLQTARNINGVAFDGTADITISTPSSDKQLSLNDTTAGKLLTVGSFGLGLAAPAVSTSNLDTYTANGIYAVSSSATNVPVAQNGVLLVMSSATGTMQLYTQASATSQKAIYFRVKGSGAWEAWAKLATLSDIPEIPEIPVVGSGDSEVPTNAMLGDLAYMNSISTASQSASGLMSALDKAKVDCTDAAVSRSGKDSNGIYTTTQWKRADGSLVRDSVLSGGTSPAYTTRTVKYYAADGTTAVATYTYTLTYDEDGIFTSEALA